MQGRCVCVRPLRGGGGAAAMAQTTVTGTSTMPATPQRAPKLLQLGAEDYSNTISILGSSSNAQATIAWLRGVCGLE